jgi:uncharacterized membrane protein YphA (DoxX/SURF4 family)
MKQNIAMTIGGWILTVLIAALLIMSAVMKFAQPDFVVKGFTETSGYPLSSLIPIGVAELASALLFLLPRTRVLGAILITGYMGGAIATHVRQGEAFFVQVLVGVFAWLGLYLRDPRIRALAPFVMPAKTDTTK